MSNGRGERIGWTGGWAGGFLWVVALSAAFLAQGKVVQGLIGLIVGGVAVGCILVLASWRHPSTSYWQLILPLRAGGGWMLRSSQRIQWTARSDRSKWGHWQRRELTPIKGTMEAL